MHGIGHLVIKNYRACRDISLPLGSYTPLVGQNNCGKSTILEAIKLVLAPRNLTQKDATDPSQPIYIAARIDGISTELLDALPDTRHKAQIAPYCVNGNLWIRISGPGKVRQEVWEPGHEFDGEIPADWRSYPTGLPEAVSALMPEARHIVAMDDVEEDLRKGKAGSTIRSLLDDVMNPILERHQEVAEALSTVRSVLCASGSKRSPLLGHFDRDATAALNEFFPGLAVDIDMPTIEIKEFFRSGDIHVTDAASGERRPFDQLGTGAQRALQMALVRLLADRNHRGSRSPARRMLLIDEPELYLHPQAVIRLRDSLKELSQNGYQVVFATHSPMMLSSDNAPDTVIVRRMENGVSARPPLRAAVQMALQDGPAQAAVLFQLGNIAEIFFNEKVVLCEGKTERRLLPMLLQRVRRDADPSICFVELGGCGNITKGMKVLDAMGITCASIADLDFAFTHARQGADSWLPANDELMDCAKALLASLATQYGFELNGNGLPQRNNGWTASDIWSLFAQQPEGKAIAERVHTSLRGRHMWAWAVGCMEDALGIGDKGEDAIMRQEERIRTIDSSDVASDLPAIAACLDWLLNRSTADSQGTESARAAQTAPA